MAPRARARVQPTGEWRGACALERVISEAVWWEELLEEFLLFQRILHCQGLRLGEIELWMLLNARAVAAARGRKKGGLCVANGAALGKTKKVKARLIAMFRCGLGL